MEFDKLELAATPAVASNARAKVKENFDAKWYRSNNSDIPGTDDDLLSHYLEYGVREGRSPCEDFDVQFYKRKYLKHSDIDPFGYYLTEGVNSGHCVNQQQLIEVTMLREFDSEFYSQQNPDVVQANMDPFKHFLSSGWREGRNPHPDFDMNFYLEENSDVRLSGLNPFYHYLHYGRKESRFGNPNAAGVSGKYNFPGRLIDNNGVVEAVTIREEFDTAVYIPFGSV